MKILTWKVTKTVPAQCPDYKPDPYTGEYPTMRCAVYHTETVTEEKGAEFMTREECESFAKKAPLSCYDFRLNGVLLKDTREKTTEGDITVSGGLTFNGN